MKQDWPKNWPTFIMDIVESSKSNESVCINNMNILALLRYSNTSYFRKIDNFHYRFIVEREMNGNRISRKKREGRIAIFSPFSKMSSFFLHLLFSLRLCSLRSSRFDIIRGREKPVHFHLTIGNSLKNINILSLIKFHTKSSYRLFRKFIHFLEIIVMLKKK